jgi:1-phosphofructokinase/6-phosphofructokinase 2
MIVTLPPNPGIDRTVSVDVLHHGEVNRATASRIDPGGKGVNVSRALTAQGGDTAVLPLGGPRLLMGQLPPMPGWPTRASRCPARCA